MKDNAIARAVGKTLNQPEKNLRLTVNSRSTPSSRPRYAASVCASRRIAAKWP